MSVTAGGDLSGSYPNPAVVQINGATLPASATFVGTNSSRQLIGKTLGSGDITGALGFTPENAASAGQPNGFATLDGGGRISLAQIPPVVTGGMQFQGVWNTATNSPTLSSGSGHDGYFYEAGVAGTTTLDGITSWAVGDLAIFDGAHWQKVTAYGSYATILTYGSNVSIGQSSLAANSGSNNVAIGQYALQSQQRRALPTARRSVKGRLKLPRPTTTLPSVSTLCTQTPPATRIPPLANTPFSGNTTGYWNVGVGGFALSGNTSGTENTAVGFSAGPTSGTLSNTTAIGYNARPTASNQVAIGNSSVTSTVLQGTVTAPVFNSTTGFQVNGSGLASTHLSDSANLPRLNAANVFTGTGSTSFAGNVGFGTASPVASVDTMGDIKLTNNSGSKIYKLNNASPWAPLDIVFANAPNSNQPGIRLRTSNDGTLANLSDRLVINDSASTAYAYFVNVNLGLGTTSPAYLLSMESSGGGYYSSSDHTWHNGSSMRWKKNATEIHHALETISKLKPVEFDWDQEHGGSHSLGFIAEDLGTVLPYMVSWDKDHPGHADGINYANLTALLAKAVQEQQQLIDDLKETIQNLQQSVRHQQ